MFLDYQWTVCNVKRGTSSDKPAENQLTLQFLSNLQSFCAFLLFFCPVSLLSSTQIPAALPIFSISKSDKQI